VIPVQGEIRGGAAQSFDVKVTVERIRRADETPITHAATKTS
jgi:hypothetical protein